MGSRAIAAVIADRDGQIISEARNRTGEALDCNPKTAHAENTAVIALDTQIFPDLHSYTLYAGLEPCVMCMGNGAAEAAPVSRSKTDQRALGGPRARRHSARDAGNP